MQRLTHTTRNLARHLLAWAVALSCLTGALWLAVHHPVSPLFSLVLLCLWCAVAIWQPNVWLWVVPACLPWLNFSPWTGWVVLEEFDILMLATLACAYGRMAWFGLQGRQLQMPALAKGLVLVLVLLVSGLVSLWRGLEDVGGLALDWFAGYGDALNSWRVAKSLLYAALCVPLLQATSALELVRKQTLFAVGVLSGLAVVVLSVVWERAAFAGVSDFSVHYRTVALFWEMHVGGAALDVYLALTAPFVVWALATARNRMVWLLAAVLAVLAVYAGLTTFSRGVYLAMGLPVAVLALWLWRQKNVRNSASERQFWRARGDVVLMIVLAVEVLAVLVGGSFMAERLARSDQDLTSRMAHWRSGVGLLNSPADWLLGKGMGRLPANYAAQVPEGEFSGAVRWQQGEKGLRRKDGYVVLAGPRSNQEIAGSYELTQRVDTTVNGQFRVRINVRVLKSTRMEFYLCERHLLYDRSCLAAWPTVKPVPGFVGWQSLTFPLKGEAFDPEPWFGHRLKMFSLAVSDAAAVAEIDALALLSPSGADLLVNGDFSQGTARWLGVAQSYFDPWHLDNLALEVLVERGLVGLLALVALFGYAFWQLLWGSARGQPLAPYLAAALFAVLLVGLVSSVMDVPRVVFLFYLMMLWSLPSMNFRKGSMLDCDACVKNK